jgi:hypothetical protein
MSLALPDRFGHVDLDDLDLVGEEEQEELAAFDGALESLPRSEPPRSE